MKTTVGRIKQCTVPVIEEELKKNDSNMLLHIMNRIKQQIPEYVKVELRIGKTFPYTYNFYIDLEQYKKYEDIYEKCKNHLYYPYYSMADMFLKQTFLSIKIDQEDNVHAKIYDCLRIYRLYSSDSVPEIYETIPLFADTDLDGIYKYLCSFKHHLLNDLLYFDKENTIYSDDYEILITSPNDEQETYKLKASHRAEIDYLLEVYIDKFIGSPHQHVIKKGIAQICSKQNIIKTMEFTC